MWRGGVSPVPPGYLGPHQLCGVQPWLCSWHVLYPRWSGWHFKVADTLHLVAVPKRPTHGSERDETFLRKIHQVLLKVDVLEGNLQCPESAHLFPSAWASPACCWLMRKARLSHARHQFSFCNRVYLCSCLSCLLIVYPTLDTVSVLELGIVSSSWMVHRQTEILVRSPAHAFNKHTDFLSAKF